MGRIIEIILFPISLPLSWVYGLIIIIRNKLYDLGLLYSIKFDIPVICVGNITVGGTGKTPHVEYLCRLFEEQGSRVAVISRGYGRKTSGFRYVLVGDNPDMVGDEPLQLKRKFPHMVVAVDVRREHGIRQVQDDYPDMKLIILDDAFQYRKVTPSLSVVLVDYNRPVWSDWLLPCGRLRDTRSQLHRADTIIVTKCPQTLSDEEQSQIRKRLGIQGFQHLYFSTFAYAAPVPLFNQQAICTANKQSKVMAVAGIARPQVFISKVKSQFHLQHTMVFADHHNFTKADMDKIAQRASQVDCILTTEKDSVRLQQHANFLPDTVKDKMFYLPIAVKIMNNETYLVEDLVGIVSKGID